MKSLLITSALLLAPPAFAQSNLGELLDQGAKKLTKQEFLLLLPKTHSGITPSGRAEINLTYRPDGSLIGNARSVQTGSTSGITGSWTIDESGKICIKEAFLAWNQTYEGCAPWFKLGEQYWAGGSDTDRGSGVYKINLK